MLSNVGGNTMEVTEYSLSTEERRSPIITLIMIFPEKNAKFPIRLTT